MEKKIFKFVKGEVAQGKPADIYFYDDVDYWDVRSFIGEFQYLENYVKPSKIRVHIISSGGSCLEGIKAFSIIHGSQTPTETINDGLAASMGSIIWAAGKERYMRDYAILMIHNPRIEDDDLDDDGKQIVSAFQKQLKIIYQQRFGFDDEKVQKIMDGEDNIDGTWLMADDAVEAGIIDDGHILKSSKETVARIAASIDGVKNLVAIGSVMRLESIADKSSGTVEKSEESINTITEKEVQNSLHLNQNTTTMTENEIKMVAAQLGIPEDKATGATFTSKVNELLAKEKQFDSVKAELQTTKDSLAAKETELTGCKASIDNLTQNLDSVKSELQVYKDKEAAQKNAEITAMVEAAITAGKISKESKDTWVKLATDNYDLAKQTLDGIAARDNISAKIADDPANKGAAADGMKSEEEKVQEKVQAAVGKDFKLLTPNF